MSKDSNFAWRYVRHLYNPSTSKVFGFDALFAWTAAILSTPAIAKLVATSLVNDPTPISATNAITNAAHARICISLGVQNNSTTSNMILYDVAKEILSISPLRRYLAISLVPAAITALCALAYHTLVSPLQTPSELSYAVLGPSLIAYAASLLASPLARRQVTITLHPVQGPVTVKVHPSSPHYEILRIFHNSISNPNNLSLSYTIQNIANKIASKYSNHHTVDGIPDQTTFAQESIDHPECTSPMADLSP